MNISGILHEHFWNLSWTPMFLISSYHFVSSSHLHIWQHYRLKMDWDLAFFIYSGKTIQSTDQVNLFLTASCRKSIDYTIYTRTLTASRHSFQPYCMFMVNEPFSRNLDDTFNHSITYFQFAILSVFSFYHHGDGVSLSLKIHVFPRCFFPTDHLYLVDGFSFKGSFPSENTEENSVN